MIISWDDFFSRYYDNAGNRSLFLNFCLALYIFMKIIFVDVAVRNIKLVQAGLKCDLLKYVTN